MPHMKGKQASTTIYLRPTVLKALQAFSKRRKVAMAQLLREAVDELLAKHGVHLHKARARK